MIVTNFTPVLIIEIYYIYLVLLGGWDACGVTLMLPFEDLSGSLGAWEALVFLVLYSLLAMGPSLTNASPTKLPLRIDQG